MRHALVIAVWLACPAVIFSPRGEAEQRSANVAQPSQHQHQSPVAPSASGNSATTNNYEYQNEPPSGDAALQWVLIGVGIVTALFVGWQALETRRAAQATRDSVGHMERQVGIMDGQLAAIVNAERAWITVIPVERTPPLICIPPAPPHARMAFAITVNNSGKTPAKITKSALDYERIPGFDRLPPEPKFRNVSVHTGLILVPDGEPFGLFAFLAPNPILVDIEKQAIESKMELLYASGFIEYRCVFDCRNCPHECRFGYVYNFPQGGSHKC